MRVTLDASVFVSAYLASDVHHTESVSLLGRLIEVKIDLNAPVLVLAEVAAALARNTHDPKRGLAGKEMLEQTPRLQLYPLSLPLGKSAAGLASVHFAQGIGGITRPAVLLGPRYDTRSHRIQLDIAHTGQQINRRFDDEPLVTSFP